MGWFSRSSSSDKSKNDGCKCYRTSNDVRIRDCKDSKSFTHERSTSKGERTTTYKYNKGR
ncbi:MAG: hypothetical protein R3B68_12990 [Phycisphaerales bacterium]